MIERIIPPEPQLVKQGGTKAKTWVLILLLKLENLQDSWHYFSRSVYD